MKKIAAFIFLIVFSISTQAFIVNKVTTIKRSPLTYSMQISITPRHDFQNWLFGFYQARTYQTLRDVNKNLTMSICDEKTPQCSNLIYVTHSPHSKIYSAGYSNVFKTEKNFPLKKDHTYRLNFENNNQGAPNNLSSMPQHFFLYDSSHGIVSANTTIRAYGGMTLKNIDGYNISEIKSEIRKHINDNWINSKKPTNNEANKLKLIPKPKTISIEQGIGFQKSKNQRILTFKSDFGKPVMLSKNLKNDLRISLKENSSSPNLIITKDSNIKNPEGYTLKIQHNKIFITARNSTGVFYAGETLRQLWQEKHGLYLPKLHIEDSPRFSYRGITLDTSRHFFTVNTIKKLIDVMAFLKLNTLHLHFSDDEGWRLELPSLSKSTLIKASSRGYIGNTNPAMMFPQANTDISNYKHFKPSGRLIKTRYPNAKTNYRGYYSKTDIQSLIQYANQRHITVIPEVDMPGHARALIHANPYSFKNPKDKSHYISVQGYSDNILPICLYNQHTEKGKRFTHAINSIVKDMSHLFKNQTTLYHQNEVSIGGDEVSADAWSNDPSCQYLHLNTAAEKSHNFFKQLYKANPSIKLSGWQQFVQNDDASIDTHSLKAKHTAYTWVWDSSKSNGIKAAVELAKHNYPTVLAFADDTYFDLAYTPSAWEPGFNWASPFSDTASALHIGLDANTVLSQLEKLHQKNVIGVEGALWSENITNARHLFYMALPKITGLAEAAWSSAPKKKLEWQSLATRLGTQKQAGILNEIHRIIGIEYRGYPNGICKEIPKSHC